MYSDVHVCCRGCLTCAAYGGTGHQQKAPLKSILVSGLFERVGVDIMQMLQTDQGNRYIIVFMDYVTKWVEAFAMEDQTIARLQRSVSPWSACWNFCQRT